MLILLRDFDLKNNVDNDIRKVFKVDFYRVFYVIINIIYIFLYWDIFLVIFEDYIVFFSFFCNEDYKFIISGIDGYVVKVID